MDLQDYVAMIRRRLWMLVTVPLIAALAAALLSVFVLSPVYQASTTLWVVQGGNRPLDMQDLLFNRNLVQTYSQVVRSRFILEKVIARLGLSETIDDLQRRLAVSQVGNTEVLLITVEDTDPDRAAAIANGVAQAFTEDVEKFVQLENVRILDTALPPAIPAKPRKLINTAVGGALGCVIALGLVFLTEAFDLSMRSVADVQRQLGLQTLGTIPLIRQKKGKRANGMEREAYRILRTNVQYQREKLGLHTILVTSVGSDPGKSLTTANLARSFAQAGARVLAVDGNLRRPALGPLLGAQEPAGPGLAGILQAHEPLAQAIQQGPVPGLDLLPAGQVPPNPAELLGAGAMQELLATACQTYDLVLIDAAPAMGLADTAILAPHTDGTLLVIQAGVTAAPDARQVRDELTGVGARLLGVVIGGVQPRRDTP